MAGDCIKTAFTGTINNNNDNNNNVNLRSNFEKTELLDIIFGVPQASILGPLFFILDMFYTQFLKPIKFADDINLFCSNKEIKPLFLKANLELGKMYE